MELKNIVLYLLIGCFCAGVGIGKFIIARRTMEPNGLLNPKDTPITSMEKIAITASILFFLFAILLFIYGMYLWHY